MLNKPIRFFFLLYIVLVVIALAFSLGHREQMQHVAFPVMIFSAIFYIVGLLIGLVISILLRKPEKEPLFYLIGQLLPLFILLLTGIYVFYDNFNKPYFRINEERSEKLDPEIKLAYENLKSKFPSPNDFLFHTYAAYGNISRKNIQPDTSYTIYLEYNLKINPKLTYYSKYRVDKYGIQLLDFQVPADTSEEYRQIENTRNTFNKTVDKLESIRDGRDSVRGVIK